MKKETKGLKKKMTISLIIVGVILILLGIFLFWFFNRKFNVNFKINDSENYTIQVKYNQTIKEEDIKNEEQLGEYFIGWYEILNTENDEDILAEESFDFSTKIKSEKNLKAVFEEETIEEEPVVEDGESETIKITFDSNGGSKVSAITLNKGGKLTFPKSPTKSGYTFVNWTTQDGKTVKNKTTFQKDTVLYAKWDKVEEVKQEEQETTKKEETISLSLSRSVIHRNGNKTSKASAKVENASGDVTYAIDNNVCVSINKTTGDLTANEAASGSGAKVRAWKNACAENGKTVKVTATLPSGKSASATLTIEKDLVLSASNGSVKGANTVDANTTHAVYPADSNKRFYVDANQTVTWSAKANDAYGTCIPVSVTSKSDSYTGDLKSQCTDGNSRNTYITATTTANQKITIQYYQNIN